MILRPGSKTSGRFVSDSTSAPIADQRHYDLVMLASFDISGNASPLPSHPFDASRDIAVAVCFQSLCIVFRLIGFNL